MPLRGLGAGVHNAFVYQQQREDELDRQAQEMALRNAMQRLNEREFDYKQRRDSKEDLLQSEKDRAERERLAYGEAEDIFKQMASAGFGGMDINPRVSAYLRQRGIEPSQGYQESLAMTPVAPEFIEKQNQNKALNSQRDERIKQAWAALENKLDAQEREFFRRTRDTIFNSGAGTWEQASEVAWAEVHARRAGRPQQAQPKQSAPPLINMANPAENPLLNMLGIGTQTPPGGAQGALTPTGRPLGKSPKAQSDMDYKTALVGAMKNNAEYKKILAQYMKETNPLKKQILENQILQQGLQRAKTEAEVTRLRANMQYDEALAKARVTKLVTENQIAMHEKRQLDLDEEFRRRTGVGSIAEEKQRKDAQTEIRVLEKDIQALKDELKVAKLQKNSYSVYKNMLIDPNDAEKADKELTKQNATMSLPDLEGRVRQIYDSISRLSALQNKYREVLNRSIERTNGTGKPFNETPSSSSSPGARRSNDKQGRSLSGTRENTYFSSPAGRKDLERKAATGSKFAKPQSAPKKETDADIMARLRKKYR